MGAASGRRARGSRLRRPSRRWSPYRLADRRALAGVDPPARMEPPQDGPPGRIRWSSAPAGRSALARPVWHTSLPVCAPGGPCGERGRPQLRSCAPGGSDRRLSPGSFAGVRTGWPILSLCERAGPRTGWPIGAGPLLILQPVGLRTGWPIRRTRAISAAVLRSRRIGSQAEPRLDRRSAHRVADPVPANGYGIAGRPSGSRRFGSTTASGPSSARSPCGGTREGLARRLPDSSRVRALRGLELLLTRVSTASSVAGPSGDASGRGGPVPVRPLRRRSVSLSARGGTGSPA